MAKNPLVKDANIQEEFTDEMLDELERCARPVISETEGIVYFIRKYVKISTVKYGIIPFELYDYQVQMLDNYLNNRWCITLTARQSGKTETSAAYMLWRAIFYEKQDILIASRRAKDAKDVMKRLKLMYQYLPNWIKPGVVEYNVHTISFDNKSEIYAEATTEDTGRGRTISLLYCDELAFVRPRIAEDFWASVSSTLATGGNCIITSTPNGDADQFSVLWHGAITGQNDFSPVEVKWHQVPGRDEKFRAATIARIGEMRWRREFNNEFLSSEETLINGVRLQNIKTKPPVYIKNGIKFWKLPESGKIYLVGVDVGTGTGGDYSTIQCFTFPNLEQIAEFKDNTISTPHFTNRIIWLLKMLAKTGSEIYWSFENNGVGEGVYASLELYETNNEEVPGNIIHDSGKNKRGMYTSDKTKLQACMDLKNYLDRDRPNMILYSSELVSELKIFARKGKSFEAKYGLKDDLISALIIVIRLCREATAFEEVDTSELNDLDSDDLDFDNDDGLDEDDYYGISF